MIRARTCFVAEGVSIDRETNKVSASALAESLAGSSFPLAVPQLHFFCLWERDEGDPARCATELLVTLNSREIARHALEIDFEQSRRNRYVARIDNLSVSEPGSLMFRLSLPGHSIAEWRIDVTSNAANDQPQERRGVVYESMNVTVTRGDVEIRRR
jgi:hypothetical protein